jgi:hypothetical protein
VGRGTRTGARGQGLLERVNRREVPARDARVLNDAMHWASGVATGAGYGLIAGSGESKVWWGPPFGAVLWAGGYVVLPQLGVDEQIWKYDLETLEKDLGAHLVYGTATAGFLGAGAPNGHRTDDVTMTASGGKADG